MASTQARPTTKKRHERILARYLELLKADYDKDSDEAIAKPKSYFYKTVADEFGNSPHFIGRIVQLGLKNMRSGESKKTQSVNKDSMDPEVRFILGYNE